MWIDARLPTEAEWEYGHAAAKRRSAHSFILATPRKNCRITPGLAKVGEKSMPIKVLSECAMADRGALVQMTCVVLGVAGIFLLAGMLLLVSAVLRTFVKLFALFPFFEDNSYFARGGRLERWVCRHSRTSLKPLLLFS
jgi:hypothetical protein